MAPTINDRLIAALVDPVIMQRGQNYYERGMVVRIVQRGDLLTAEVQGSEDEPYCVQIQFDRDGIDQTECSCPYNEEWGGVCKHVVAALLTYVHRSDVVEQRPPIADVIGDLDQHQLRRVLLKLAQQQPATADLIERIVRAL